MSDAQKAPDTRRRWILPALFLSVAVNLLIVGILAGWLVSPGGPRGDARINGPARGLVGEPFVRALPTEDRRALLRSAIENRDQLRQNRDDLSRRLAALLAALEAQDFNPASVENLLQEQRETAVRRQKIGEKLLIERLSAMTHQERIAYAERLRERLKHLKPRSTSD